MQTIQYLYSALALASILVVVILLMAGKSAKLKGRNIYLEAECETKKRIITECLKANVDLTGKLYTARTEQNNTVKSYIGQLKEVEESRSNVYEELERLRRSYNTLMTERNEVVNQCNGYMIQRDTMGTELKSLKQNVDSKSDELLTLHAERGRLDYLITNQANTIVDLQKQVKDLTPIKRGSNQGANGRFVSKEKIKS